MFFLAQKLAYVQVPYYEKYLSDVENLTNEECLHILSDVLSALIVMHQQQFIYGTLTPDYVLLNQERRALLQEVDCTKTLVSHYVLIKLLCDPATS